MRFDPTPKRTRLCVLAALCFAAVATTLPASAQEPRATMQQVFGAISQLLPLSAAPETFEDPANRERIEALLEQLALGAEQLNDHAESRDDDFLDRSRQFSDDVARTRLAFNLGRFARARAELYGVTQDCVGCHSRGTDPRKKPLAGGWLESSDLAKLPHEEKANLYVATRRFERALTEYEALFADPEVTPFLADESGWIADYLAVALRVRKEPQRARATLVKLGARPDAPRYLETRIARWITDLDDLSRARKGDLIPRVLVLSRRHASEPGPFADDQLVENLVLSGLLLEWLDQEHGETPPGDTAMAWFRLAVLDARTPLVTSVPRAELYMEAALRADPGGPLAAPAYEALEEWVLRGYGAPGLEQLPRGERMRMEELEALVGAKDTAESSASEETD